MTLDEINKACRAWDFTTAEDINGFKVLFRGYIPSVNDLSLVGIAVAFNPITRQGFVCKAGTKRVAPYRPGEMFDISSVEGDILTNFLSGPEVLLQARDTCMSAIKVYLACL